VASSAKRINERRRRRLANGVAKKAERHRRLSMKGVINNGVKKAKALMAPETACNEK